LWIHQYDLHPFPPSCNDPFDRGRCLGFRNQERESYRRTSRWRFFFRELRGKKDIIRYKNWRCQQHHWELHHVKKLASLGCQSDNNSKGLCIRQLQTSWYYVLIFLSPASFSYERLWSAAAAASCTCRCFLVASDSVGDSGKGFCSQTLRLTAR